MQQITMRSQYKKAPDLERLPICNSENGAATGL